MGRPLERGRLVVGSRRRAGASYLWDWSRESRDFTVRNLRLDAAEQLVVGVAEGAHALALELGGERGKVDAGASAREGLLGVARSGPGAADLAVVGERAQCRLGHRVDHAGAISCST